LLLTPEETAQVMGIGRTKVYELLRRGVIDSVQIGFSRRVPVAALHEYLDRLRRREAEEGGSAATSGSDVTTRR
jgi:excisionase family DNA binding protein